MTVHNYVTSVIRTGVQLTVGALVAWLLALGIDVGAEANTGLTIGLTALVVGIYYAVVRLVEPKLPAFLRAILMGGKPPVYTGPMTPERSADRTLGGTRY